MRIPARAAGTATLFAPDHMLIDLMFPPQAMAGVVYTTSDIFRIANRLRQGTSPGGACLPGHASIRWRMVDACGRPVAWHDAVLHGAVLQDLVLPGETGTCEDGARHRRAHRSLSDRADPPELADALVVPPLHAATLPLLREIVNAQADAQALIQERHAAGVLIAACGSGIGMLAAAGVLAGRQAAVPWILRPWFSEDFPDIVVASTGVVGTDGGILSASTPSLQTNLTIRMIGELGDIELANRLSSILIPENEPTSAEHVSRGIPIDADASVIFIRAVQWMRGNLIGQITLNDIAIAAGTTVRTLQRHFAQQVNQTPGAYLVRMRIERARHLLLASPRDIEGIAVDCGYLDVRAFRRAFRHLVRMTPSQYRQQCQSRGGPG